MEGIFTILIPILGIVFALIGSKEKGKDDNNQKQQSLPKQSPQRHSQSQQRIDKGPVSKETVTMAQQKATQQELASRSAEKLGSAEEQYNQQLEMLRKDITSSTTDLEAGDQKVLLANKKTKTIENRSISIKQSLTKGGIREAIIMSEVLASPKALSNQRKRRI